MTDFQAKLELSRKQGEEIERLINAIGNAENNIINYGHVEVYRLQYEREIENLKAKIEVLRQTNPKLVAGYGY